MDSLNKLLIRITTCSSITCANLFKDSVRICNYLASEKSVFNTQVLLLLLYRKSWTDWIGKFGIYWGPNSAFGAKFRKRFQCLWLMGNIHRTTVEQAAWLWVRRSPNKYRTINMQHDLYVTFITTGTISKSLYVRCYLIDPSTLRPCKIYHLMTE